MFLPFLRDRRVLKYCTFYVCDHVKLSCVTAGAHSLVRLSKEAGARQPSSRGGSDWSTDLFEFLHHWCLLSVEGAPHVLFGVSRHSHTDNTTDHLHPGRLQQVRVDKEPALVHVHVKFARTERACELREQLCVRILLTLGSRTAPNR